MRRFLPILALIGSGFGQVSFLASGTGLSFGQAKVGSAASSGAYTYASHTPNGVNHAVVIFASCAITTATPSAASISASASGWTFTAMSGVTGSTTAGFGASWGAISPNTTATTFTVTFTGGGSCGNFGNILVAEATGNNTTGGTTTFYTHNQATGTSTTGCSGAGVTSTSANDGVWSACNDNLATTNWQGAGWTASVNDANGDGTETKIATGSQTPTWTAANSTSGAYVVSTIAIAAAGGGAAKLCTIALMGAGPC
jgi:hypothetical protein